MGSSGSRGGRAFEELCGRIGAGMKRLRVPGVSVGVFDGGVEHTAGFGKTSVENPLAVTPDTLFQVGSISKTLTATILVALAEGGSLDLDAPVRGILPGFKMRDREVTQRLTTRQLLTHTGGWIGDYFDTFGDGDDALAKMVRRIGTLPQVTPLGQAWSYNNSGFNIAGRLIEVLTGLPYEAAARKFVLGPLGMDMSYYFPSDIMITHRFVCGHRCLEGKPRVTRPWAIGRAGNCVGGLVSTVRDLLVYARFHMGDGRSASGARVMGRRALASMRRPQVDAGGRGKMGLSWFIHGPAGLRTYGHGGATHGQQAAFLFMPERDFAATILTNSEEGGRIADRLREWVLELWFDTVVPPPEHRRLTSRELAAYAGHYELPLSSFDLVADDGRLVLKDRPRGGFPTPDTPPGPADPDARLAFYAKDRVICLDGPRKDALGEFLRDKEGRVDMFRVGGRLHPRREPGPPPPART